MYTFATAADVLRQVFMKLDQVVPAQNDGTTLFTAWSKVLGGPGRTEFNVISSIADILSVMDRLESQIQSSRQLDDFLKSTARQTVAGFRPLFSFGTMTNAASALKTNLMPQKIGQLAMIGLSIKDEFQEPKLSDDETDALLKILNEVQELLKDTRLPSDLRVNLARNIEVIIWWISRPDIASLQDVLEKSGATLVLSKQIAERTIDSDVAEKGRSISESIVAGFKIISNAMKFLVNNADNVQKLESATHLLLGDPPSG